jgi:EmrB/QacA subfamily drug resistance transporter
MPYQPVTRLPQQIGIIISASFAGFMVMLDNNIVNISLPYIARYYDIGTSLVVRISLVYFLMLCSTMILFGKLADRHGVKKIFVTGFSIFTVSSLLCGLSPSFPVLLAARAFQGIGGSMLISTAISLITLFIPAEKRGWAFGIFSPINSLGVLVGSPLGGLITGMLNWHWIFLVNVPLGIAAILVALRQLPADPKPEGARKGGFDIPGMLLSFLGLAMLVSLLNNARALGYTSAAFLGGLVVAFGILGLFVIRERKAKDPLLDLTIFRDRNFSLALLASLTGMGLLAGNGVLMPFYLTYILNIKVNLAGFVMMIMPVIFSVGSMVIGPLSDRMSRTRFTVAGMIMGMIACTSFALLAPLAGLAYVILYAVLQGVTYSLFITPNNNLVMSLAPEGRQSVTSSLFRLSTNLGQILGILLMEAMFTFAIPSEFLKAGHQMKTLPLSTLTEGFRFSYIGGALLCLGAFLFSVFVRDSGTRTAGKELVPEGI